MEADYAARLIAFCAQHGWDVHANQRLRCVRRLDNPRHCCGECHDARDMQLKDHGRGLNLDHVVLLRRGGTSNRPEQWALLSQPYADTDPSGCAVRLGPAPYGHGTHALLYIGKTRTVK